VKYFRPILFAVLFVAGTSPVFAQRPHPGGGPALPQVVTVPAWALTMAMPLPRLLLATTALRQGLPMATPLQPGMHLL